MRKGIVGAIDGVAFGAFRVGLRVVFALYFRLSIRREAAVEDHPVIVCSNHQSFLDSLLVGVALRPRLRFVMTDMYADVPGLRWFFRWNRVILVREERSNREMFRKSLAALKAGDSLAIFPEGQISLDGSLAPFLPGALSLALRQQIPIVPVALVGAHRAMHRTMRFPRPRKIRVRVGAPIAPEELFPADCPRSEALERGAERLRDRVAELMQRS